MATPSPLTSLFRTKAAWRALLFALWTSVSYAENPAAFFVAPNGSDSADGSVATPFATLEKARESIRSLKRGATLPAAGAVVTVQPGTYTRTSPFLLTADDSGTQTAPIVWRAASSGEVTLDCGVHLDPKDFQPLDEIEESRLAPEAKGRVVWLDLKKRGVHHIGPFPLNFNSGGEIVEFYFDGERLPISRWPNAGSAKIERVTDKGESAPGQFKRSGKFVAREERVARWPVDRGVWVEGYWRIPWDNRTVKVAGINPLTREISLAAAVDGGLGSKYAGPEGSGAEPWWAVNLLEEIDQLGEWSIDFQNGRLYWWPKDNWKKATLVLSDMSEPVVRADKTAYLTLEGFHSHPTA